MHIGFHKHNASIDYSYKHPICIWKRQGRHNLFCDVQVHWSTSTTLQIRFFDMWPGDIVSEMVIFSTNPKQTAIQ